MGSAAKNSGIIMAIIGISLIVVGSLAYIWGIPYTVTNWGTTTSYMDYPFRDLGIWLLVAGLFFAFFGLIIYALVGDRYINVPNTQPPQSGPYQQVQQRYCANCNRQIPIDSIVCPYCGQKSG